MSNITAGTALQPDTRKVHCNSCLRNTNHVVLFSQTKRWSEDVDVGGGETMSIDGANTYSLVRCAGCDDVRFLHEHWFSEDWDDDGPTKYQDYYPPQVTRNKPDWVTYGMPIALGLGDFGELLDEVYKALPVKALRLATMGVRSLVEKMMIDRVGDQGTFEKNIQAFFDGGFVAPVQQDTFKNILVEAGHAAMHRDWEPSYNDVTGLLDIVEGLIKAIYVDPAAAKKIGERIPPRTKAVRAASIGV